MVSASDQAAAQVAYITRSNPLAATATKLGALTSAGDAAKLLTLTQSLETLQQSSAVAPKATTGTLGRNLDLRA